MKTLVISSQYPLPEIGGNRIRTMNFVRYFKKCGDVDLAYYQDTEPDTQPESLFRQEFPIVRSKSTSATENRLQGLYEQFRYAKPWIVCSYSKKNVQQLIDLIEQGDYDQIVCRYAVSAYPLFFLSEHNRKKVIVDIDDIMTADLYESVHGSLSGIRKLRSQLDCAFYRRYQTNCARIGKALTCSEDDRQQLVSRATDAAVHVVPNVAPKLHLSDTYNQNGFSNLATLLFVGNLAYKPNVTGLEWFVKTIFSRLITDNQEIRLLVVGKDPDSTIRTLCDQQNQIELIENPESITPFYEQAGVVIVPLLTGGGTRIKILEAGLAKRPVISTDIGAYGLSLQHRRTFLSMHDYQSFRDNYDWLKQQDNYNRLVHTMNLFVQERFTTKNFDRALDKVIAQVKPDITEKFTPGLVSVIVPVYNRAELVGKTIESILAQTYTNLEIIAINDGSTDRSLDVLTTYADRYPGKLVVIDQQNTGQVRARNVGLQHAQGEFIAFLDSDDTWEPEKLALQLPLFAQDVGLVYCGINEVDQNGMVLRTVPCETNMRGDIHRQLLVKNRMTGGSVIISRKALHQVGLFDECLPAAENWDLWIRIARNFKVNYCNQPLINYLKHPGNLSADTSRMSQAGWAILQKHLPPSTGRGELKRTYKLAYANFHYNHAVMHFSAGDYQQARISFLHCWRYQPLYKDSAIRMLRSLLGRGINRLLSGLKTKLQPLLLRERHDPASC